MAALTFSFDTLKTGGHFLCKFYQGNEDRAFEFKLKRLFAKVHREKPDSSRSVGGLLFWWCIMLTAGRNPRKPILWLCAARRHRREKKSFGSGLGREGAGWT